MNTSEIDGAVIFRITDLQLAFEIDQLSKKYSHVSAGHQSPKLQQGNGHAKDPQTKNRILEMLREEHAMSQFTVTQAAGEVKSRLGVGTATLQRALKMGIQKGEIIAEGKGIYHFLQAPMIQQRPATGSGKQKEDTP
jgi:hypothetical protein